MGTASTRPGLPPNRAAAGGFSLAEVVKSPSAGTTAGHRATVRTACPPGRVGAPGQAESPVRGARSAVAKGWELRRKSEHEHGRRSVGPGHHLHARPGPAGLPGCGGAGQAVLCRSRHRRGRRRREGQAVVCGRDSVPRPYLCACRGTGVRSAGSSRTGPDRPATSCAARWPDRDARCGRLRPLRFPRRRPAARAQCAAMG